MKNFRENLMHMVFFLCALTSIFAVVLICIFLFANGVPAMKEIGLLDFLTGAKWKPGNDIYGILPMILGSLYITAGAIVIGVPIGLLTAVFMAFYCPKKLYGLLKPCTELLAGIPSIVYGLFGMLFFVTRLHWGYSLLAGAMSACFSLGLESGAAIQAAAVAAGVKELFALNPVILLVTLGGFATNAAYCIFCNVKNRTGRDYFSVPAGVWVNNVLFCALAGVLWYSQFFGLGMGKSFFAEAPLMLAFSWSILMSLNVLFSNLWGILLHEWRGVDRRTAAVLVTGLLILIFSTVYPQLVK